MGILDNYLKRYKEKRVAVIGAGVSNTPLIGLLLDAGVSTTVRDKRLREELGEVAESFEKSGAKLRLGEDYLKELTEDIIFRTPGLMPTNTHIREAVARGAVLTSEMEVFFEICPCKIIAVTGSDGKTTTTSIIAELLKKEYPHVYLGGNIGTPLLSKVDDMNRGDIAVVELSSFQLITMKKSPNIAVVTNLSPNHLDVHNDMDEYIEAKSNIFMHQTSFDRVVFNYDNEITRNYAKNAPADEVLFFSRKSIVENGVYLQDGTIYESFKGAKAPIMKADEIELPGVHNVENYMAAFAAVMGILSHETMRYTAMSFKGVPHRLELVRELDGVKYYNDSIASSPSRAIAGIRALSASEYKTVAGDRNIILIAGGQDKGIPFDEFGAEIVKSIKELVLTGVTVGQIREAVENAEGFGERNSFDESRIHMCDKFEDAVTTAAKLANEGDIVLLSPACTSFYKFRNFEERGRVFKEIVDGL